MLGLRLLQGGLSLFCFILHSRRLHPSKFFDEFHLLVLETTMRSSAKTIATAAFSVFLMSGFLLGAGKAAAQATTTPYPGGRNIDSPKFELFVGYSYLQAVPKLAEGNRLVWLNGGSSSLAYNLNRHLGIVADLGDYTNSQIRFQGASLATVDVNDADGGVISFLFGLRLSYRKHDRLTPFVQLLHWQRSRRWKYWVRIAR